MSTSRAEAPGCELGQCGEKTPLFRSDLTAFQDRIDVARDLRLVEAVFRNDLGHEIVVTLERAEFILGKLAPFRANVIQDEGFGLAERSGICRCP